MSKTCAYRLQIRTDSADKNAVALFSNRQLVAILVELSDQAHGSEQGRWAVETTFGMFVRPPTDSFATAPEAADWVSDNIYNQPFMLGQVD